MSRSKKGTHPAGRSTVPAKAETRERVFQGEFFPRAVKLQKTTTTASYYSGPLPSPQDLYEYNQVDPGAADRIITMAEREQAHRHVMETGLIKIYSRNSTLGIFAAWTIGIGAIAMGGYLMSQGASLEGTGVALGGLATLIAGFFFHRVSGKEEK